MIAIRQHFGLTRVPFGYVKPGDAYRSTDLAEAEAALDRLLLTGGLCLCVGEPGAGKTVSVDAWAEGQNQNEVTIKWLDDPGRTVSAFLRRSVGCLGIAPAWGFDAVWQQLVDGVADHHRETAKHVVFVIDEAQDLPVEVLEQLRRLTNLGRRRPLPLSYVLIAHRDFLAPLGQQHLTALRRRLRAVATLAGLTREEITPYVSHHLELAGSSRPIFGDDALELLWSVSRGLPRVVGTVALTAMALATADDRLVIEASMIQRAAADLEVQP